MLNYQGVHRIHRIHRISAIVILVINRRTQGFVEVLQTNSVDGWTWWEPVTPDVFNDHQGHHVTIPPVSSEPLGMVHDSALHRFDGLYVCTIYKYMHIIIIHIYYVIVIYNPHCWMLSYCAAGSTDMGPPLFEVLVANSVLVCVTLMRFCIGPAQLKKVLGWA